MDIVSSIINFIKGGKKKEEVPEGLCPNCWGRQEYNGEFYKAIQHEEIDTNNVDAKRGWIQGFVAQNLEGIALFEHPDSSDLVCSKCKTHYKKEK
jgi:hypothetical protein